MCRTRSARVLVFGSLLLLTLLFPAIAVADKPVIHAFEATFEDDVVCGVPVTTHVDVLDRLHIKEWLTPEDVANGVWFGHLNTRVTVTFTNAVGETLVLQVRRTLKDLEIIDHGDGTWTISYAISGISERLIGTNGTIYKDVGRILIQDTIYLGDLTTFDDDQFLTSEILRISGPHPLAESDGALFCEVFVDELG